MTKIKNEFAAVGPHRMDGNPARQALEKGTRVSSSTRKGVPDDVLGAGLVEVSSLDFEARLAPRRVVLERGA